MSSKHWFAAAAAALFVGLLAPSAQAVPIGVSSTLKDATATPADVQKVRSRYYRHRRWHRHYYYHGRYPRYYYGVYPGYYGYPGYYYWGHPYPYYYGPGISFYGRGFGIHIGPYWW